jgi:proline iminopeptidase
MSRSTTRAGTVRVNGGDLRYRTEGSGPPILVLGSASYYPDTFSQTLREHAELVFLDVRHFARLDESFAIEDASLQTYARDIDQARVAMGLEGTAVLGHSHHGNLALEYTRMRPEAVTHLVLVGSTPTGVQATRLAGQRYWRERASRARKQRLMENLRALESRDIAAMSAGERYIARYVADGPRYWYDPAYDASSLWRGVPVNMPAIQQFRAVLEGHDFASTLERVSAPVLVMAGRHDYVVPPTLWDDTLPGGGHVSCHLFDRSGHTPQLEEPDVFDATLLEWLRDTPEATSCSTDESYEV